MNIKKTFKIILAAVGGLLLLVIVFILVLGMTNWGQQFVTTQVNNYLKTKLKTPFAIGRISYEIPDWIQLENVYFETPKGDTLLSGGRVKVDLDMMDLLQSRITLNRIELDEVNVNIKRTLPDTAFNFNFLIDAFSSGAPADPADTSSAPLALSLAEVALKDVKIRYWDDIAGADVRLAVKEFRGKFDEINPAESRYHIAEIRSNGLSTQTRIYKGIDIPTKPNDAATVPGDTLDLQIGDWQLRQTNWNVQVEESGFATTGKVGELNLAGDQLYLEGQQAIIRTLELFNSDISATLTKSTGPKPVATPAATQAPADPNAGWKATLGRVRFANNRIQFNDENAPRQAKGMDYSHLDIQKFTLNGENLVYQPNLITGKLRQGSFVEKGGLRLQRLDADVVYSPTQVALSNFRVQTPGTLLQSKLIMKFDSLGQIMRSGEANRVSIEANLNQNKLSFADILTLVPTLANTAPFKGNEKAVVLATIQAKGTLANLALPKVEFSMLTGTKLQGKGRVSYPTDPNKMGLDLTIQNLTTNSADIRKLAPAGSLPDSLQIAPQLQLAGTAKGRLNDLKLDAKLNTAWGNVAFNGSLKNFVTGKNQAYAGTATLEQLDLGKWLMNPKQYGLVTATATVDGRGIDPKTMATTFDIDVPEAFFQGYTYRQFAAKGNLNQGLLNIDGGINDPNARLTLNANANMKEEYPTVKGNINIQQLDLYALKLYTEPMQVRGNITMDFTSTNPEKLIGTLRTEGLNIQMKGENYPVDSLYLTADANGDSKTIIARTPFAEIDLGGNFKYADLASASIAEINRYVTIPELKDTKAPTSPTDFTLKMRVRQHPLLLAFVPGLTRLEPVKIEATLDSKRADSTLNVSVTAGAIEYDTMLVAGANLKLGSNGERLVLTGNVGEVRNKSLHLYQTTISATAAQNQVQFKVMNKDSVDNDRHGIAGRVAILDNAYQLHLDRNALLTNYRNWTSDTTGYIQYSKEGVVADKFTLETDNQSLIVNSTEPRPNAPLHVEIKNVILSEMAKLANQDSTLVGGTLNGDVIVKDYLGTNNKLSFTGELKIDSLDVMQKALGTLQAKFANTNDNRIGVETTLQGPSNDVRVEGFYNPSSTSQALDLNVELKRLDTRTIEAFSFGQLRRAKGQLTGNMKVNGAVDKPKLNGQIQFDSVGFNLTFLNATYAIDQEKIVFDNQTIRFDKFDLKDSLGRVLTTDGTVNIAKLPEIGYNLNVTAKEFSVLNASRRENELVYGNASISADLRIRGAGSTPSVVGSLKVDDGSNVTMVVPDNGPSADDAEGIVTFIQPNDTTSLMRYLVRPKRDTLSTQVRFDQLSNSSISLNLSIDEHSSFTVVVDEQSGDFLKAQGNANLNVTMDASGTLGIFGRYEVTDGMYSLNYQGVLKRNFIIQKGSSIVFAGDPLKADVDITAIYQVKSRLNDLLASESSQANPLYANKVPFNVALKMNGNLAAPVLSFDVTLPENAYAVTPDIKESIETKLTRYRQDEAEINKQVFSLLVLGSFMPENSFDFFSGGGGGNLAENTVRNSVSKLLSDQLNRLASNVIKGVDLNIGLNSSSDYANQSGSSATRTDLSVGLSKSFLDGRLSVTIGKNFALENTTGVQNTNQNQVFDNLSVNYNLTRDGRYVVRAYRKNELQNVLEGFIIETGLGFIITVDYNTFSEIFNKSREDQ